MNQARLLVVHTDQHRFDLLESMLQSLGHRIDSAENDRAAVKVLEKMTPDLILAGADPTDPEALELLAYVRRKYARVPILMVFTDEHRDRMSEARRMGAAGTLRYPCPAHDLRAAVLQALPPHYCSTAPTSGLNGTAAVINPVGAHAFDPKATTRSASSSLASQPFWNGRISNLPGPMTNPLNSIHFVGDDLRIRQALDLVHSSATARLPMLIVGETGVGKSLLARLAHQISPRREGIFLEIPTPPHDDRLEHSVFGDADPNDSAPASDSDLDPLPPTTTALGRLMRVQRGTLVIDELANLTASFQSRLLRFLDEGCLARGRSDGSSSRAGVDLRLIVTTRHDPERLRDEGWLRPDLFYRLAPLRIDLPPLRERLGDLEQLAEFFRELACLEQSKPVLGFTSEALEHLRGHSWPGNLAELKSVVERGVILARGHRLGPQQLVWSGSLHHAAVGSPSLVNTAQPASTQAIIPLKEALEEPEKRIILQALQRLNWNRQETARRLDINRTTLYKKMKKYGLYNESHAQTLVP